MKQKNLSAEIENNSLKQIDLTINYIDEFDKYMKNYLIQNKNTNIKPRTFISH